METGAEISRFLRMGRRLGETQNHILERKELESPSHMHFAKGDVFFQQPGSVRAAVGHSCAQAALTQLSADLSVPQGTTSAPMIPYPPNPH